MYTLYGISNCTTVKKALDWLKTNRVDFEFYDYKRKGISEEQLKKWCDQIGWETVLNKNSATWKGLDESEQAKITTEKHAISLMKDKTSTIKRPLLEKNNKVIALGFNDSTYKDALKK